ncbi:MAG: condensation domain-containing protein [Crocinitomicaceae bacterium]
MRIESFLAELIDKKIHIGSSDGELSVKIPKGTKVDPEIISTIRERKQEIINYLEGLKENTHEAIPATEKAESYPISDAQRRLYVLYQMDQEANVYLLSNTVFFKGDFDQKSFTKAVHETVKRHESLRTVFKENEVGEIKQWILPSKEVKFTVDVQDFQSTSDNQEEIEAQVQSYIEEDSRKEFDLENGPLIRAALMKCATDEYLFYYVMHHIICDGWSIDVLQKDVEEFYDAFKSNRLPKTETLRIQYKDYASWQLNQLESQKLQESRSFWMQKLEGDLPQIDLPTSLKRPTVKTSEGRKVGRHLSPELSGQIRELSTKKGGSLFITVLACFKALVYRYTAQSDLIIGTPIAGRNHPDLENQIGFYVNTLALRNQLNPEDSFDVFYQKIKEDTLASFDHQMYPFDRLVEELDVQRNSSRSAVFDIFFTVDSSNSEMPNFAVNSDMESMEVSSKFDLEIILQEYDNYLSLYAVFNPAVYEEEMIAGLLKHYEQLLKTTVTSPEVKISEINYLSREEERELLFTFNNLQEGTEKEASFKADEKMKERNMLTLFENQVAKTPQKTAVLFSKASVASEGDDFLEMTYQELDKTSNRLANYLQAKYEVESGDFVTVLLERSEWLVVAALAIMKFGATYVPVDPAYPENRVTFIVKDSQSKLIVDEALIQEFIYTQTEHSSSRPKVDLLPTDLAYVIYTSGSTGTPKGVMIKHESLSSFFESCSQTFNAIPELR